MINFLNFHCERKLKENRSYLGIQHAAFSTELVSFLPFDTVNILVVYLGYASFSIRCFLVYLFVISVYLISLPIKKEKMNHNKNNSFKCLCVCCTHSLYH